MHSIDRDETTVRSVWRGFVRRYGWRAYAVVVLTVITVAVVVRSTPPSAKPTAQQRTGVTHVGSSRPAAGFDEPAAQLAPVTIRTTTDTTRCGDNAYPQLAIVSLNQQRAWMCAGHRQIYTTAVTTGAHVDNDQTPTGSWRVQARQRDRYLVGPGYRDYVHYWVPFNGDFGFHDAPWQTMSFGSQGYLTQGSHGCVHLPEAAMKWFYNWATVGDTVIDVQA